MASCSDGPRGQEPDRDVMTATDPDVAGWWIWDSPSWPTPAGAVRCWFRRHFDGAAFTDAPVLRISADSRYRALLNGEVVSRGPCRGTPEAYRYETVPLAGRLRPGQNTLAVEVLWYGPRSPWGEVHLLPGLWAMIGPDRDGQWLVTDTTWEVARWSGPEDAAAAARAGLPELLVDPVEALVAPADLDDVMRWMDLHAAAARQVERAQAPYVRDRAMGHGHELVPREIPPMEETPIEPAGILECGQIEPSSPPLDAWQIQGALHPAPCPAETFWGSAPSPLRLDGDAHTHYVIVNMGRLVTGRVRLHLDVPAGSLIELRYAEALSRNRHKAVRDDPAAGTVEGYFDSYRRPSAGPCCIETFAWRTFRFLRIAVHHRGGPATIRRLDVLYTAYPFVMRADFESSDPLHRQLWDISWRTARLCAHEHYEDCPYYEQLQYVGDTRLQALVSYMATADFRLARQALRQFARSRRHDGMISSRTPLIDTKRQIIPNFALIWIEFLEDYWRYSGDATLPAELMDDVCGVLDWFEPFDRDGLLRDVPYWVFTDWSFPCNDERTAGSEGELNLRRVAALQSAARMAGAMGRAPLARDLSRRARRAAKACRDRLRRPQDGLFADNADGTILGEHASLLAVLYDVVGRRQGRAILRQLDKRTDLARTTLYYSYYTFQAYARHGLWEQVYRRRLHNWTDQLALHATTWFERPEPSRSDCHAWGSWILCELLSGVLGVSPEAPGFARVRVAPHLLDLSYARGRVPTVRGDVAVAWQRDAGRVRCEVELPPDTSGSLVGPDGSQTPLPPGRTETTWADPAKR
ncbi:MAG: hypothetical protein GXY74_08090 [Phycisphaerae bacterium]|nr:hypothetical protein [Phycisphaerae bacterium]